MARLGLFCGAWPFLGFTLLWLAANGPTVGVLQLFGCALACLWLALPLPFGLGRWRWPGALGLLLLELAVPSVRWVRASPDELRHCFDEACGTRGPPWAFLAPEDETGLAGLLLSRLAGVVSGEEERSYEQVMRAGYAQPHALANPQLLFSTASAVHWYYRAPKHEPSQKVPCVVFLHGFGGLLTPYLDAMARSKLGERYALAAPALDDVAPWWSARGGEVLERTIASLPPEVDRDALYLVGLSNGSIGGARYTGRFRAAGLLSGVGEVPRAAHVLVISGTKDARIDPGWVRSSVEAQHSEGRDIAVEWLEADHFLILSREKEWTARAADFFDAHGG